MLDCVFLTRIQTANLVVAIRKCKCFPNSTRGILLCLWLIVVSVSIYIRWLDCAARFYLSLDIFLL
jgi:hypothetical protein